MKRPLRSPPVARPFDYASDLCRAQGLDLADLPGRRPDSWTLQELLAT